MSLPVLHCRVQVSSICLGMPESDTGLKHYRSMPVPLERETGIEPALLAWKARALPLSYSRGVGEAGFEPAASASRTLRADQAAPLSASVTSLDNDETYLSAPVNCECHRIIFVQLGNG